MDTVFLVVYGLFVLATPILVLALYIRFSTLRTQLNGVEEESAKQTAALRREITELRKQIAAKTAATVPDHRNEDAKADAGKQEPAQHPIPPVMAIPLKPTAVPIPIDPAKVEVPPKAPVAPHVPEAQAPTKKAEPNLPTQPTQPVIESPAPVAPLSLPVPPYVQIKPATRVSPTAPKTPAEMPTPAASTLAQGETEKSVAARVSVPPAYSPLRVPATKRSIQERLKKVSAFEEALGTNWLQKLGIVLLVFGVASFGIYELAVLGNFGKILVSYLVGVALLVGGILLEKRERYQLLGRTGIGGGWALCFFTTYSLYHVAAMRVLNSLVLDSVLMLVVAAAMAAHTLRYRSQLVTGLAFLLGYSTVALSQDTVYSLSAGVVLAIGLVVIVWKMRWYELEIFGILSSYLNQFYWLYRILGISGARGHVFPEYGASTAILFFYWIVYRVSYLARKPQTDREEHVSTTAAILNSLLLLATIKFQSVYPELAYITLLVLGAIELAFGQLVKRRREAFVVLSVMGSALLLAAAPSHYAGPHNQVAILWLVGMEVCLATGVMVKEVVFRRVGLATGVLMAAWLAHSDLRPLLAIRMTRETREVGATVLFAVCAAAFYGNALGIGRRWKEYFEQSPDRELLISHSYLGVIGAAVSAWAFFVQDWMALGFAALMLVVAWVGKRLASQHIQMQYLFLGILTGWRAFAFNLHFEHASGVHLKMRLVSLPLVAVAFYGTAKLAALRDSVRQRTVRGLLAAAGTAALVLLIWVEAPELWRPVALIMLAVALAEVGRALKYTVLAWHTRLICLLAGGTALTADPYSIHRWHTMPVHALSGLVVIAGFYWLAWRGTREADTHLPLSRAAYTWSGGGLMMWALLELLHTPWVAVGWIAFSVMLALAARRMSYEQLAWQANLAAVCAVLRTVETNYAIEQSLWQGIRVRFVTVALVAAGLYFVSRKGAPNEAARRGVKFLHSFAATGLLAALMFYEAPNGWLAPLWAGFALALAVIDRHWESEELPWQAHILSLLAFVRAFAFNLQLTATWHNWSVRLLSVALVAVIFYAMAQLVRIPKEARVRDLNHAYSWAASMLASMVLWHEMQPLGVAVGWAAFGLVLFEYGLLRKVAQFRCQAYVALIAAFVRIFFVNLTAGQAGEFWGSRLYTTAPLVLIFFFVYAQLPGKDSTSEKPEEILRERAWHVDGLVGCLGTAAIAALLGYQFVGEWVVTAWAALVLIVFGVTCLLDRKLFLYQGIVLTLLTFTRGVAHNLFGSGYFSEGDWKGRYVVVGVAVALLLASLAFAFPLRRRYAENNAGGWRIVSAMVRRPEQLQFFAAVVLLWLMLTLKMNAGMKTVAWGIEGVGIIVFALLVRERSFRLTGLGLLLLCVAKIMAMDVWGLQARDRYITLIIVGSALLLVSYLYSRYRETIRQFL